jgi:fatty-acyl-CoA synthase
MLPGPNYGAAEWLAKQASLVPEREALVEGATRWTYAQLNERVTRLARVLRGPFGIGPFERVATLSLNSCEFLELFYATARIRAMLVPLNIRLSPAELAYQLRDSAARVLFVGPELTDLADQLPDDLPLERRVVIGPDYEALLAGASPDPLPRSEQAAFTDPHAILYTSGTTGRPKGAVLTHANWFWNSVNMGFAVGLSCADTTLTVLPMFHCGGIGLFTVPTLHRGGRVVLLRKFDPAMLLRLVRAESVALVFGVPFIWLELLKDEAFTASNYPSIRYLVSGGAPHPLALIEQLQARGFVFLQGYGLTETAPGGTLIPPEDARRKAGTVGKPVLHVELRIVDEEERDVPPQTIGEVLFRGPNVFAGYWNLPQATAEAFTADGWFRTGDLGLMDDEGFVTVIDRKKDMIISGGENIYSAEVEDVLFAHPAVADAAVIGIPDPRWGEAVRALVVPKPGATLTAEEVIAHCRTRLARYKVPKSVIFVESLPRNAAGKVLKRELRRLYGAEGPVPGHPIPAS